MYNSYRHTRSWPDGGSMLSQPSIAVELFNVIESQERKMSSRADRDGVRADG